MGLSVIRTSRHPTENPGQCCEVFAGLLMIGREQPRSLEKVNGMRSWSTDERK